MAYKEQEDLVMTSRNGTLPPELLIKIFQFLANSQGTMYNVSVVCKQWLRCAAPILYASPRILDTFNWASFIITLTKTKPLFPYGDMVRTLDLSSGKSLDLEAVKDNEFIQRLVESPSRACKHQAKLLPFIILSTSSLIRFGSTCKNLTAINLSYTSLLNDTKIMETGEYTSTLQHYAVPPGLTQIDIPIKAAIEILGRQCKQLRQVHIQRCEWVTAHIIWLFAYYCPNLVQIDARRSTKCSVKRLIATVLEYGTDNENTNHDFYVDFDFHQDEPRENIVLSEEGEEAVIHFVLNDNTGAPQRITQRRVYRNVIREERNVNDETERILEQELAILRAILAREGGVAEDYMFLNQTPEDERAIEEEIARLDARYQEIVSARVHVEPRVGPQTSLKDVIYDILMEARGAGNTELAWIEEY